MITAIEIQDWVEKQDLSTHHISKITRILDAYPGDNIFKDLIFKLKAVVDSCEWEHQFTALDEDGDFIRFWYDDLTGWNSRIEEGNRACLGY